MEGIQTSLFDDVPRFKIKNKVRLIELFAGIGSQAKSLERLGVDFEHYRVCEFDRYAVRSYNAIHGTNFEPSDIRRWKGEDLGIEDTDKYTYILTYSFPCTDLSVAGKMQGMSRNSGTRSGLLWEVERLLMETSGYVPHRVKPKDKIFSATEWVDTYRAPDKTKLPQVLLMENVPQVCGGQNISDFEEWLKFLENLGYANFYKVLNAKDYGVPQNRERCYMISILGDYYYDFPKPKKLEKRLNDLLEEKVDEKYYLSQKTIDMFIAHTEKQQAKGNGFKFEPTTGGGYAKSLLVRPGERTCDNFIIEEESRRRNRDSERPNGERLQRTCEQRNDERSQGTDVLIYDGYNQRIRADQSVAGTITGNVGKDLKRNGQGVIERI